MARAKYFLLFVSILCFAFLSSKAQKKMGNEIPLAKNGVLDLRNSSINDITPLRGEWQFFWRQLISDATQARTSPVNVNFPFRWDKRNNSRSYPSKGYATYALTILLPTDRKHLAIQIPQVYSAARLFINGRQEVAVGNVSDTERTFKPFWLSEIIDIHAEEDTLHLYLQLANFSHKKGGINQDLFIGPPRELRTRFYKTEAIDWLLAGGLFIGGFFFLGLYLLSSKDKAILSFAIYSIIYSYRMIGADSYEMHKVLHMSWAMSLRLEYLSLYLGVGTFALYTKYLYPQDFNKYLYKGTLALCGTLSLMTIFGEPYFFTGFIDLFLSVILIMLFYLPYVYFKALRKKRPGSLFSAISLLTLLPIFLYEIIHYWDPSVQLPLLYLMGYTFFFFFQSMVLSNRFSYVLKTAKREAEQGLLAKSNFLSTMSHEVRTPLNSVIGISHLLLQNSPRNDQQEQLETLLFSANNLTAIVNDILDYNKLEAGKIDLESIDMDIIALSKKILNGQKMLAEEKELELRFTYDPPIENYLLKGDPTRYYQVVNNIIHNALKFTARGYVELCLELIEETKNALTLKVQIKDSGIGIAEDKLKYVFERFTQADSSISRSYGGTGLGLSICKKILEIQDSELQVLSKPGKGSIFFFQQTFEKTLKPKEDNTVIATNETLSHPLSGKTILLVDDNAMNVLVAKSFLQRWGVNVTVAVNGKEAIETMAPGRFDLVLMDLHMPLMDGYEATEKIRLASYDLPIIALTADVFDDTREKIRKCGMTDILSKPFTPDDLQEKIIQVLKLGHKHGPGISAKG